MSEFVEIAEAMVGEYWPLHGPYSPEHAQAAVSAVAELVRYLNYATGQGADQALPYASHVYSVVGGLKAAAGWLEQTLRQLEHRATALGVDPTLGHAQQRESRAAVVAEAAAAQDSLAAASGAVLALYEALNAAHSHLAWLYHREAAGDD